MVAEHAISEELKVKLLGWRHPGFSVHVGEPIPPNDTRAIEDMASYVVRNPVSLKRLVYIDGHNAVVYRALRTNPSLGANFVALDPLEWLARIADHIPDPGKHRTLFYAYQADPLTCRHCGGPLQIVAYIHDQFTIKSILENLGLSPPEIERPPPELRYVPLDHEGRTLDTIVAEGPQHSG